MIAIDLLARTFGRLVVTGRAANHAGGQAQWTCRCECGGVTIVRSQDLRNGHTTSCGCQRVEASVKASLAARRCHSLSRQPIYAVWKGMLLRCHQPEHKSFANYGARGIAVCPAWWDFETFYADFGHARPNRQMSMDRVDNDDGYWPGNVRWATAKEQANNRRPPRRSKEQS